MPETSDAYEGPPLNLAHEVSQPSYVAVLDWMKSTAGPHVSFDFWARGNYTRRLLFHRQHGIVPLQVAVSSVEEMAWAWRRLLLTGLPVDFIFLREPPPLQRVVHLHPWDMQHDGGWGYLATLDAAKIHGRKWFPVVGSGRFLPQGVLDWVVSEASAPFLKGNIFVAPADLIGVNAADHVPGVSRLSDVTGGTSLLADLGVARTLLDLELPYVDNLPLRKLYKFLDDYESELEAFRAAARKLVLATHTPDAPVAEAVAQLKTEVAILARSAKYQTLQQRVTKVGGVLATFSASLAVLLKGSPDTALPMIGAAGLGAAFMALLDLWRQATAAGQRLAESPYFVLWKLGLTRPFVVRTRQGIRPSRSQVGHFERVPVPPGHHWLCPPTNGLTYAFVRESAR